MPTLIATAGASNANSYCTLTEANAYHDVHLYATTWTDADDDQRIIALIWATRMLDEICDWLGEKVTTTQALRWPRSGVYDRDDIVISSTVIPTWLKNATAELARHLLAKDRLQTIDDATNGLKSADVGSISVEFDKGNQLAMLPASIQNIIGPYAGSSGSRSQISLTRV